MVENEPGWGTRLWDSIFSRFASEGASAAEQQERAALLEAAGVSPEKGLNSFGTGAGENIADGVLEAHSTVLGEITEQGTYAAAGPILGKVANRANHIFGEKSLAKHKLGGFLDSFGGDKIAAFRSLESGAQNLANSGAIKGVFRTVVEVGEHSVTVQGRVIDDVVNVSTAFIP